MHSKNILKYSNLLKLLKNSLFAMLNYLTISISTNISIICLKFKYLRTEVAVTCACRMALVVARSVPWPWRSCKRLVAVWEVINKRDFNQGLVEVPMRRSCEDSAESLHRSLWEDLVEILVKSFPRGPAWRSCRCHVLEVLVGGPGGLLWGGSCANVLRILSI